MTDAATQPAVSATLNDVARAVGVSLATVDRVVNRREGVRAETVARVEAAVAKLGYHADVAAARLARGQSFRFAFVLPSRCGAPQIGLQASRISSRCR
jgi:LacI family transcriptional regulator